MVDAPDVDNQCGGFGEFGAGDLGVKDNVSLEAVFFLLLKGRRRG